MKRLFSRFLLSALLGVAILPCSGCRSVTDGASREKMTLVRAGGKVRIDGVLSPEEWGKAPVYRMEALSRDAVPVQPRKFLEHVAADPLELGQVQVMYDEEYLYVGARLRDSDVMQYGKKDQAPLYDEGDTLEVFVKAEASPAYWECFATPHGKRTTFFFETRRYPRNPEKNVLQEGFRTAAVIQGTFNLYKDKDEGWTVEIAFPIAMLEKTGVRFAPGNAWTILIARYNYNYGSLEGGARFSAFPKLPRIDYHLQEYYASLIWE